MDLSYFETADSSCGLKLIDDLQSLHELELELDLDV